MKPHLSRYWLNTPEKDPVVFAEQSGTVCTSYAQAVDKYERGDHTLSTDEMTGIQALERKAPTKPWRPGQIEKREFEYIRHGTQTLIANLEIANGQVIAPSIGFTRTEADFAAHIAQTIATDPEANWTFITDQLNTHQSEALVGLVAQVCQIDLDLGIKGKARILESMPTRATFLSDPAHRIRFIYTPKHSSWLNQIEIWFSTLVRRVLKRSSFMSTDDLRQRLLDFIAFFNKTAKPYKWTYKGRPLQV
ncbi:MAG: transposase [Aggregatilineales bacterium]